MIGGCDPFLSQIIAAIDARQLPLHLAVQMTSEYMHSIWDACKDPYILHEVLVRTHPKAAMLPLARQIAVATRVPLVFLENVDDVVEGSHRWRSYVNTRIRGTVERLGSAVINKLLSWDELPLAWMESEGLFRPGVLESDLWLLEPLHAAGPPTLEDVVRVAEGGR